MPNLKEQLIEINKEFHDGTIRYEGDLDGICSTPHFSIVVAILIAERHPFVDGNKRTAIRLMEKVTKEKVPLFVYDILEKC